MAERHPDRRTGEEEFSRQIAGKAERRLRAQSSPPGILRWLSAFGVVGWTIALPATLGVLIGRWLDGALPGSVSWTLTLLLLGLLLGATSAWMWLRREGGRRG